MAFKMLNLRHTCCYDLIMNTPNPPSSYADDFAEIREEDATVLTKLAELVLKLEARYDQCNLTILAFLEAEGLQSIQETVDEVNGTNLKSEEKSNIEDAGVRLGQGPALSDDTDIRTYPWELAQTFDIWAQEFERIKDGYFSMPWLD